MPNRRPDHAVQDLPFAAPVRAIGDFECAFVQRAMARIAPAWSVEMAGICAEEVTLVLLPAGGDDAMGPGFMISRENYGFRLDQVHWDVMTELGVFGSLKDVTNTVGVCLASSPGGLVTPSVRVH